MDISTNLIPSVLSSAFISTPTLCHNHLGSIHTTLSILCHILLCVIRTLSSNWPQSRRSTRYKTESNYHEDQDIEDYYPFSAHFFSPKILQHYCLIWLSIITSPKGKQLDFWLFLAVFMDCAPVVISIYNTINYALWLRNMGQQISDPDMVVWRLTSTMRQWSPAYQLNNWIMNFCDGCVIKHCYILFFVTLAITQTHKLIVSNLYCVKLHQ